MIKNLKKSKYGAVLKASVSLIVAIGLIICLSGFLTSSLANESDDTSTEERPKTPQNITILWEDDISAADIRAMNDLRPMSEQAVLTVAYILNGSTVETEFTQSELEDMMAGPFSYSNFNTFPSYGTNMNISGVPVIELFIAAGVNVTALNTNQAIKFISGDGSGYSSTMTVAQLTEERYFFSAAGVRGDKVPAIVGLEGEGEPDLPRNFFGQAAAGEQTRNSFVRSLARIEIGGDAGSWGQAAADPVSGTTVSAGDSIRLTVPNVYPAEAKIYYTLNSTNDPTRDSAMYNLVASSWFSQRQITENAPIVVPPGTGTFTINTKIIGLGRDDGPTVTFIYPYYQGPVKGNQAAPTGLVGSALAINETTDAMEYSTSQTGATGWIRCANGSTSVTPGTYFVRFAETETLNAGPVFMVVVNAKQNQSQPGGLTNGFVMINGTTTDMEYHTDPYAENGWIRCSAGNTAVAHGTYFVRFAETATFNASPSTEITIGKQNMQAPLDLVAGPGVINGTTTEMEYNTNHMATTGWIGCTNISTSVTPGTYFVRFRETETHNASATVMIVVTDNERGQILIRVHIGGRLAKEFDRSDINALRRHGPHTYSHYNTWPTYGTIDNVSGVRVLDLLAAAGVSSLSSGQGVNFTSGDGYTATVTVGQLEEPRFFFGSGGARGSQIPSIISFTEGGDYRRLAFGQASANEQINQALVKDVVRIDVGGGAGNWGAPGVEPAVGAGVKQGDPIRLTMPPGQGDAKIHYTLDGSAPTRNSPMYNPIADRWLFQRGMTENTPISAPSGSFTINARIIGIGRSDGPVVSFKFNGSTLDDNGDDDSQGKTGMVVDTTIEDLKDGKVVVASGDSVFVPAEYGSVKWDETLFDGYYDYELGGYVLTPKPGVTGEIEFTYVDEDGVEHTLTVTVEETEEDIVLLEDPQVPQAENPNMDPDGTDSADLSSGGTSGETTGATAGGTTGELPQWAFITLCSTGAVVGGASGMFVPGLIRKAAVKRAAVKSASNKGG